MTEFELECWARDLEKRSALDKGLSLDDAHRLDEIRHTLASMNGLHFWPYRYTQEFFKQPLIKTSLRPLIYRSLGDVEEAEHFRQTVSGQ
jgi:hypothetical protein